MSYVNATRSALGATALPCGDASGATKEACGDEQRIGPWERVGILSDAGTFRETENDLSSTDPLRFVGDAPYARRLQEEQDRTGQGDAVITGTATLHGHPIVLAIVGFNFLGGSMGVVVGEKVTRAIELALDTRCPLVTVAASGGARMQEGAFSLLQMAKTAAGIKRLRTEGIPHLSVLTNPTTGGVFASFGSLGDVILAEPKALIGFAGPRVVAQTLGAPMPPGAHTAEFLLAHGMIDNIVKPSELRDYLGALLDILCAQRRSWDTPDTPLEPSLPVVSTWEIVQRARAADRPTCVDYIARAFDHFVELRGDRVFGDDPAMVTGVALLAGLPVAVIGTERGRDDEARRRRQGRPCPEGFRKAQRIMCLAARLKLPVITLIDTPGAFPGVESEERGLAGTIAETLALMSDLPTPIVAAVIGEGGSGGALALALADRVLMQEQAIYSVISPEGAATILYRDASRAAELAPQLKLTAWDLKALGVIDAVVAEPAAGAAADPDTAAILLRSAMLRALSELQLHPTDCLLEARFVRYREVGRKHVRPLERLQKGQLSLIRS